MATSDIVPLWRRVLGPRWHAPAAVLGAALSVGTCLFVASTTRYRAGDAFVLDFGFFRNALVLIAAGHPWATSGVVGFPSLADHLAYVLYPLAFVYKLLPYAQTMFALQALALALAAVPLYGLARRWAGDPAPAAALALAYLVAPWLWSAALFDFHPEVLFPLALFSALYFAAVRRLAAAAAMVLLALSLKEVLAPCLVGVAIWWAVLHRSEREERRWALVVAAAALAVAVLDRSLQVHWAPAHAAFLSGYFGALLGGRSHLLAGLAFALGHPAATMSQLAVAEKWHSVARALMATGFSALADPAGLLAMLPGLGMTLGSSRWPVASGIYAEALPLGTTAFVAAVGALRGWTGMSRRVRMAALAGGLVTTFAGAFLWTTPFLANLHDTPSASTLAGLSLLRRVPPDAPLGVSNDGVGALASGRTGLYRIDGTLNADAAGFYAVARRADYLLYPAMTNVPTAIIAEPAVAAANLRAMGYRLVADRSGWLLWRRTGRTATPRLERCAGVGPLVLRQAYTMRLGGDAGIETTRLALSHATRLRIALTGSGWLLIAARQAVPGPDAPQVASEAFWLTGRTAVRTIDLARGKWQWIWVDPSSATPTPVHALVTGQTLACSAPGQDLANG